MANQKLTGLTELLTPADDDMLYAVDVSDTTDDAAGSSRKIDISNLVPFVDVNHYGSEQLAIDAAQDSDRVYVPGGTYSAAALDVDGGLVIWGDGPLSVIQGKFLVPDESISVNLVVSDLTGDYADERFIESVESGAANIVADIRNVSVASGTGAIVGLRSDGTLRANVQNVYGEALTKSGVAIGYNDYTASTGWGPIQVDGVTVDSIHPADTSSHYGVISYSPYSILTRIFVRDVGSTSGSDTEGVYTKARHSVISDFVLVDAGEGEAFLNMKGQSRGSTSAPQGYGVVAGNGVLYATSAYSAAAPGNVFGVDLAADDQLVHDIVAEGFTGASVTTQGVPIDNARSHHVLVPNGTNTSGSLVIQSEGQYHVHDHYILRGGTSYGVRIAGQDAATHITLSDFIIEDHDGAAFSFNPTTDSVLNVVVRNAICSDIDANSVIRPTNKYLASLTLDGVDCGDLTTHALLGVESGASAGADEWTVNNLVARRTTTNATTTNIHIFNVPTERALRITAKFTASDGTDAYIGEYTAAITNNAGTAAILTGVVTVIEEATGAVAWTGVIDVNGADVRVRVTGEAATTVDWKIRVDMETI